MKGTSPDSYTLICRGVAKVSASNANLCSFAFQPKRKTATWSGLHRLEIKLEFKESIVDLKQKQKQ